MFWIPLPFWLLFSGCTTHWGKFRHPSSGPPQSIGKFAAGCVAGATELPPDGDGYQVMRLSRRRSFGHPALVDFLKRLALQAKIEGVGPILVGDMGQPRGGPMVGGHRSHQSGLDADLWFVVPDACRLRPLTADERETISAECVVADDRLGVNRFWKKGYEQLLKLAATDPETDRIFVNPAIKQELCKDTKPKRNKRGKVVRKGKPKPWLAKIRPWWGHDYHFHVRLRCQPGDALCVNEADPIPPGDGCHESLEWWFSDEVLRPSPTPSPPPKALAELPDLCHAIAREPDPAP